MAEFPALPLWTDAFHADTAHLSDAECGLYLRLLITIWRAPRCRVPNDDKWLTRKLNQPPEVYRPIIKEFCKCTGNWVTQKRLVREWNWIKNKSIINRMSAKSRWEKEKTVSERNAPTPTPTPTPTQKKKDISSSSEYSVLGKINSFSVGGNGHGLGNGTTLAPEAVRAKFHQALSKTFDTQKEAWEVIRKAEDKDSPGHAAALVSLKARCHQLGKKWPYSWT